LKQQGGQGEINGKKRGHIAPKHLDGHTVGTVSKEAENGSKCPLKGNMHAFNTESLRD
jgi:hypothetical protein